MAETNGLLNRRRGTPLPRVRIPPSPPISFKIKIHVYASSILKGHENGASGIILPCFFDPVDKYSNPNKGVFIRMMMGIG